MRVRAHGKTGIVTALLAMLGCGDDVEVTTFTDEGDVCLSSDDASAQTLDVTVTFDSCASGCARVIEATCEAALEADEGVLQLESHARVEETIERHGSCPDACVLVEARCSAEAPDGDQVTVAHGDADPEVRDVRAAGECG